MTDMMGTVFKDRKVLCALVGAAMLLTLCSCGKKDKTDASTAEPSPSASVEVTPAPTPEPTPTPDPGREAKVTAKSGLKLRTGPGKSYDLILVMPSGALVRVFDEKDGWAEAEYEGSRGWCSLDYLSYTGG